MLLFVEYSEEMPKPQIFILQLDLCIEILAPQSGL